MSDEYILNSYDQEESTQRFSTKKSTTATLLVTFLGSLGIHRFYTGYFGIGLFQLITCGGFGLWSFIDLIAIYTNKYNDSTGRPLANYSAKLAGGLFLGALILGYLWVTFVFNQLDKFKNKMATTEIKTPLDNVTMANDDSFIQELAEGPKKQEEDIPLERMVYEISTKSGLNIVEDRTCYSEGLKMICGTIQNINKKTVNNVTIKFQLFDKDKNFVAMSTDKVYMIAPGGKWNFRVPIYYDTVTSYRVFKITSY